MGHFSVEIYAPPGSDLSGNQHAERALNAEMDRHLGQEEQSGNNRNGYARKTVISDTGQMEIAVPRDRKVRVPIHLTDAVRRTAPRSARSS